MSSKPIDMEKVSSKEPKYMDWVKRLGQWHLIDLAEDEGTLCGMPCLGNNYANYIPEEKREKCPQCHAIAEARRLERL